MDGHGHIVAVRFHHHFLQLLGREEQQTTGGGIVGIGLAQIGRPGTQRAVCQQLDAGDLETAVAKAVIPAVLIEESLHFLQTVHQRLLRHAQLEDALVRGFADAFHHVIGAAVGEVFEVVALDGGDAAFKQVGLALDHLFQQLLQTGGRQVALDIIQNDLLDNTVVGKLETNILPITNEKKIPVFGSEIEQVRVGCAASASIDYIDVGASAGKAAAEILGGKSAAEIPVAYITEPTNYYNSKVCGELNLTVPTTVTAEDVAE